MKTPSAPVRPALFPPGFTTRFHQVTYAMVVISGLPLFTTGILPWVVFPIMLGVLGYALGQDLGRWPRRIGTGGWNAAVAVLAGLAGLRALDPDSRFSAFLHLLLILQAYRLLTPKRNREYIQVYLLAFFQLLVTTAYTPNFSLAPMLLLFMIVSTWALAAFQFKRGLDDEEHFLTGQDPRERPPGAPSAADSLVGVKPLLATALIAVGTFVATFPIFYSIPRIGTGFFLSPLVSAGNSTGFTDEVKLGAVGKISLNNNLAMRVEFAHPEDVQRLGVRHLRGIALNHYDGEGWSKRGIRDHGVDSVGDRRLPPKRFMIGRGPGGRETIEYTIYQEPLGTSTLFGFYDPFQMIVGVDQLRKDDSDNVSLPRAYPSAIKYIVQSTLVEPDPARLRAAGTRYDPEIRQRYLGLPAVLDPRIGEMATRITQGARTPYDKAVAVRRYLEDQYTYTLDLVRDERLLPLEDFLFEQRQGHCEYFATALAVMLRELDVPTRVVNGFVRGEWNEIGEYLLVRQSDAHTWVEVYFPGAGWIPFDPSPRSIAPLTGVETSSYRTAQHAIDAVRMAWNRYVLDFSVNDQRRAIGKMYRFYKLNVPRSSNPMKWFSRGGGSAAQGGKRALGVVLAGALVAFALYNLLRTPGRGGGKASHGSADATRVHGFYADMLEHLKRRGLKKDPAITPREFQRAVRKLDREAAPAVRELTDLFEEVRFGGRALGPDDEASAKRALETIRRSRADRPPPASKDAP